MLSGILVTTNMKPGLLLFLWLMGVRAQIGDDVDDLAHCITHLEDNLSRLLQLYELQHATIDDYDDRATVLQGDECPDPWFQYRCRNRGVLSDRCLPSYMVCDGVADCPAGDDEKHCDLIMERFKVGTVLSVEVTYDRCSMYKLDTMEGTVTFSAITVDPITKSIKLDLPGIFVYGSEYTAAPTFHGVWIPASKSVYFPGAAAGGVDAHWKFDLIKMDKVIVYSVRRLTNEICGRLLHYVIQ